MTQWLRISFVMQRTQIPSLVWELRSHMPWSNQACLVQLERSYVMQLRPYTVKLKKNCQKFS